MIRWIVIGVGVVGLGLILWGALLAIGENAGPIGRAGASRGFGSGPQATGG